MNKYNIDIATCDCCETSEYSTSVRPPETFRQYEFEDDFEHLCTDCAEDQNTLTADSMSDRELIAAIVSDSLGYASPHHAALHVAGYREGKEHVFCERGGACFDHDLFQLIEAAVRHWGYQSDEKREKLLAKVARWQEIEDDDHIASMGISLSAPVGGF